MKKVFLSSTKLYPGTGSMLREGIGKSFSITLLSCARNNCTTTFHHRRLMSMRRHHFTLCCAVYCPWGAKYSADEHSIFWVEPECVSLRKRLGECNRVSVGVPTDPRSTIPRFTDRASLARWCKYMHLLVRSSRCASIRRAVRPGGWVGKEALAHRVPENDLPDYRASCRGSASVTAEPCGGGY